MLMLSVTVLLKFSGYHNDCVYAVSPCAQGRKTNPVYLLVAAKKNSGTEELIDQYEKYGPDGVKQYCREKLVCYLYNKGEKPSTINLNDYTQWRWRVDTKNMVS